VAGDWIMGFVDLL